MVDFSTHQIVLDVAGGGYQNLPSGMVGTAHRTARARGLAPARWIDGVHSQADDLDNEVRKDIEANYFHELEESNKKRKSSRGSGYSGMMGSMMGGGMMGGGRR